MWVWRVPCWCWAGGSLNYFVDLPELILEGGNVPLERVERHRDVANYVGAFSDGAVILHYFFCRGGDPFLHGVVELGNDVFYSFACDRGCYFITHATQGAARNAFYLSHVFFFVLETLSGVCVRSLIFGSLLPIPQYGVGEYAALVALQQMMFLCFLH